MSAAPKGKIVQIMENLLEFDLKIYVIFASGGAIATKIVLNMEKFPST